MRKVVLMFLIVASMVFIVNKPLFDKQETFRTEALPEKHDDRVISDWEVASFLEVWPKYVNSFVSRLGVSSLSLTTSRHIKHKLSYITIAWLNRQGWDATRFFYVEERLRTIVLIAQNEQSSLKIIEVLQKQLLNEKNKSARANLEALIKNQKESLDTSYVTKKELEIVRPYVNNIAEILDLNYKKRNKVE